MAYRHRRSRSNPSDRNRRRRTCCNWMDDWSRCCVDCNFPRHFYFLCFVVRVGLPKTSFLDAIVVRGKSSLPVNLSNVRIERLRCAVPATVDQLSNSQKHSTRTRNLKQTGTSHLQELAIYQTLNNPEPDRSNHHG